MPFKTEPTKPRGKNESGTTQIGPLYAIRMEPRHLERKLTIQTIVQLLESGITSQPNPSAPSRVPHSQQQHQLQPQHSWQGWWCSDNWHNWSSWSQDKWRHWQDSSHQFENDTGMFVSSLLLIFSSEQLETACMSDVAHFLFVRQKVPTSMWPMDPCNSALLTAHSSATHAPRWDWHTRVQVSGSPGHSRESGITQYLGAEMSIATKGSASDPHPLRSAPPLLILRRDLQCVQKHLRHEPRHQGGKSCKHNTPRAPQIPRAY